MFGLAITHFITGDIQRKLLSLYAEITLCSSLNPILNPIRLRYLKSNSGTQPQQILRLSPHYTGQGIPSQLQVTLGLDGLRLHSVKTRLSLMHISDADIANLEVLTRTGKLFCIGGAQLHNSAQYILSIQYVEVGLGNP